VGDKVVLSGNFLIDSQAHLSSGMSGVYGGSKEFSGSSQAPGADAGAVSGSVPSAAVRIELHADPDPLKAGEDNIFQAKVTGPDGKAVSDGDVTVTFLMPAMPSMGMPEMKSSIALRWSADHAMYIGTGRPGMAGLWTVLVEARRKDSVIATMRTHMTAR
jgi:hypothetical protein